MSLTEDQRLTLRLIRDDCLADTQAMEGQLMSGRLLAENFGYVRAMIASLCSVIEEVMDDQGEADSL